MIVGYHGIIKASLDVSEEELQRARGDESIIQKLHDNPQQDVLLLLVDILEMDSEESQYLEKEKGSLTSAVIYHTMSEAVPEEQSSSSAIMPSTPPYSQPHFPLSYETPTNKRKISETSFGTRSTETTPNKLAHPEAKVQSLQNKFVDTIINKLWGGQINVSWAKGRHMFLNYAEFSSFSILS